MLLCFALANLNQFSERQTCVFCVWCVQKESWTEMGGTVQGSMRRLIIKCDFRGNEHEC